jgi:thymidylate synthase (FAD)
MSLPRAELIGAYADDLSVVNAAKVSGGKRQAEMDKNGERLIGYLLGNKHGTPFEHNYFRFHVVVPIFAQRDWMRHRVGHSFNEVSTRWQDMDALGVYEPDVLRNQVGKIHEYQFEDFNPKTASGAQKMRHAWRRYYLIRSQQKAMKRYKRMLKRGYAREQAMATLPMGTYTEFWWSCNARSLMHFLSLRQGSGARKEIRMVADQIEKQFAEQMPITHAAWVKNGKVAP